MNLRQHICYVILMCLTQTLMVACGGGTGSGNNTDISVETEVCVGCSDPVPSGNPMVSRFIVRNLGSSASDIVTYDLTLGPNLVVTKVSCKDANGAASCPMIGATQFTSMPIPPSGVLSIQIETIEQVLASFSAVTTLKATEQSDGNLNNNSATRSVSVFRGDLEVSYKVRAQVPLGESAVFVVTITNNGPDPTYLPQLNRPTISAGEFLGVYPQGEFRTYLEVGQSTAVGYDVFLRPPRPTSVCSTFVLQTNSSDFNLANNSATTCTEFTGS